MSIIHLDMFVGNIAYFANSKFYLSIFGDREVSKVVTRRFDDAINTGMQKPVLPSEALDLMESIRPGTDSANTSGVSSDNGWKAKRIWPPVGESLSEETSEETSDEGLEETLLILSKKEELELDNIIDQVLMRNLAINGNGQAVYRSNCQGNILTFS